MIITLIYLKMKLRDKNPNLSAGSAAILSVRKNLTNQIFLFRGRPRLKPGSTSGLNWGKSHDGKCDVRGHLETSCIVIAM